jgi:hypothetical protein
MSSPPAEPTPQEKVLKRVLIVSLLDGWSVIAFAAFGILLTLLFGDLSGMAVGVMIAFAGVIEIRGRNKLKRRNPDGMKLLVRSQLFLLAVILAYCASRLGSFDGDSAMGNLTPDMEAMLKEGGLDKADILPMVRTMFFVLYGGLAVGTCLFQGGMALYYRRRIIPVTAALTVSMPPPYSSPPPAP